MWMIFSFGSKKSLDFYFKKLMLGMGPRALMNIGQMLCHGSIFPAHEKPLQIGESSLSCHPPKSKKRNKMNKQTKQPHALNSHHPVVFASFLVTCSLCALL